VVAGVLYQEAAIRSAAISAHEQARALRLADVCEKGVLGEVLSGPLNMAPVTLACVFHGRVNDRPEGFRWQDGRPNLCAWVERMGGYASIVETLPPPRQ
jgi:glutathione S-transferase